MRAYGPPYARRPHEPSTMRNVGLLQRQPQQKQGFPGFAPQAPPVDGNRERAQT